MPNMIADTKIDITTPNKYSYQPATNLHLQGVNYVTFTVEARNDAHITLQPSPSNFTRYVLTTLIYRLIYRLIDLFVLTMLFEQ